MHDEQCERDAEHPLEALHRRGHRVLLERALAQSRELNREAVRLVYGADSNGQEISEAITSTSVAFSRKIAASAGPLEPAFPGY